MKSKLLFIFAFVAGGAIGASATYFGLRTKTEYEINKRVEDAKTAFREREDLMLENINTMRKLAKLEEIGKEEAPPVETTNDISKEVKEEFIEKTANYSSCYVSSKPTEEKEEEVEMAYINSPEVENEVPFVISPDDLGELDYEIETLYYFIDGTVTDDNYEPLDNYEILIGEDFVDHYGEYEDDCVYIRNDQMRKYYEVLKKDYTYDEFNEDGQYIDEYN